MSSAITLSQLARRINDAIAVGTGLQNVWIVAETVDVRVVGGHCYMELVEKDGSGRQQARIRANCWANRFGMLAGRFLQATGQRFGSDMKVMVQVTVTFHAVFGLALNIVDINPTYTMGDMVQRRMQMVERLRAEGIIDMNRTLPWPAIPQRIAVISARTGAGYGDFIRHLFENKFNLRFTARLFPATLQGENTAPSIIAQLERIAAEMDQWDCVVIIRGGGSTTDLVSFDNYDLAANIAQFPLPVIVGIGHDRDVTLPDYVANRYVKTPTAAADLLIEHNAAALAHLQQAASTILQTITDRLSGCHRQLSYIQGQLPAAAQAAVARARNRLTNARLGLASICDRKLAPQIARLANYEPQLSQAIDFAISRERTRLDGCARLLEALSPEATLRRGYSITRVGGRAVSSVADVTEGAVIETTLADGTIHSTITTKN